MKAEGAPELLSHYCSNDAFVSIVTGRTIRLSALSASNDHFEGKWIFEVMRDEFSKREGTKNHVPSLIGMAEVAAGVAPVVGFCLSEVSDLLSQWRGYGSDGAGVSIGFSGDYLSRLGERYRYEREQGFSLQKVVYNPEEQIADLQSAIDRIEELVVGGALRWSTLLTSDQENERLRSLQASLVFAFISVVFKCFVHKSPAFNEEKEWRVVRRLVGSQGQRPSSLMGYRGGQFGIVPYFAVELLPLDLPSITQVILGPKNRSNIEHVEWMLKDSGFDGVKVYRSKASYR